MEVGTQWRRGRQELFLRKPEKVREHRQGPALRGSWCGVLQAEHGGGGGGSGPHGSEGRGRNWLAGLEREAIVLASTSQMRNQAQLVHMTVGYQSCRMCVCTNWMGRGQIKQMGKQARPRTGGHRNQKYLQS